MVRLRYDFYVYIMASVSRVLYVGVTNDLIERVEQHKDGVYEGFSKRYKTNKLVYYEYYNDIKQAIHREKEIKAWRREKKIRLIESMNPTWKDLYWDITDRDPSSAARPRSG
ncbi:MAG: GIY-YIG nuclease family protein [Candidatus Magasanikbacteria bacterium]|nr:GIY-YIG nuclease family protein [Candidatus Magasanikbacteria bacterium]